MRPDQARKILSQHKLAPSKQRGQNFLVQPGVAERIIEMAGIEPTATVVELGVGLGALTGPLAARCAKVIGLELDAGIVQYHRQSGELPANVELRHQDLLRADYIAMAAEQGQKIKIIANLPYSLTNPLLFRLLAQRRALDWVVLMIQKEVADRLVAAVGSKEYGVLTVLLGACATVERLLAVGPGNFFPRPKVDSVVIRLDFQNLPHAHGAATTTSRAAQPGEIPATTPDEAEFARLRRVVDAAFNQRRKTLLNSLSAGLPELDREAIAAALAGADLDSGLRAERLSTADFRRLVAKLPSLSLQQPSR